MKDKRSSYIGAFIGFVGMILTTLIVVIMAHI